MSARRSTAPSVQLFPFLAVLVCVMGALIFLLLVTTRRIRQQTIERAAVIELQQQFEAGLLTPPREVMPIEPEVESREIAAPPMAVPIEEPPPPEPVPLPPPGPSEEELRAEWEQIVAALQVDEHRLQSHLKQAEVATADELMQAEVLESQLQDLERRRGALRQATTQFRGTHDQSARQRTELERELSRVEGELRGVRVARAQAAGRYSIVPYDGQSGTTRRPIVIECTESGLSFAAEGITLTPQQLNGFTPTYNPLLAGADALITYWAARDLKNLHSGESTGRPYVMLVVRPGGTTGYYVARRLLEGLDQPFGYELVTDNQQFAWPGTDPAAVSACRRAIDAMLVQRDRLIAQTRTGRAPVAAQLQFADQDGRFYLEEVERLRRGQKTVNVGGRQFERAPQPATQAAPRIVDIPFGGNGPVSGGIGAPRPLQPAITARELGDSSNNGFGSAMTAHHGSADRPGVPGEEGSAPPADEADLNGNAVDDGDFGSSSGSVDDRDVPSASGTGTTQALSRQSNSDPGDWAYPGSKSDSRSGTQGGGELRGRASLQAGPTGTTSGPLPTGGSIGAGRGADTSLSQRRQLRSADGQLSRDTETDIRHWGVREIGSSIGLEREVVVRVGAEEVQVARERPIEITSGISREDLQEQLAGRLDAHVRGWGRPPRSFYWLPTIRFQVLPGGNQYQERLNDLTDHWGLRSSVEQVLE